MLDIIRTPDEFFERAVKVRSLLIPALIVTAAAFAYGLQTVFLFYSLVPDVNVYMDTLFAMFWLWFLEILLLWPVLMVVLYILIAFSSGRVNPGSLFGTIGWGFAPMILAGLIRGLGRYLSIQHLPSPAKGKEFVQGKGTIQQEYPELQEFLGNSLDNPIFLLALLIELLLVAGCGYYWALGIKHDADLDMRTALKIVLLPLLVYLAYIIFKTFTGTAGKGTLV